MRLTWSTADPAAVLQWLAEAGLPSRSSGSSGRVELGTAVLEVAPAPAGGSDRLELSSGAGIGGGTLAWPTLAALGWATVDAARLHPTSLERLPDEVALGARAWVRPAAPPGFAAEPATIFLEPATEGLLAAALARHGEGPACLWVRGARPLAGTAVRSPTDGPLGPARLLAPRSRFGPFVLLLDG
jgi:hypothetical protein